MTYTGYFNSTKNVAYSVAFTIPDGTSTQKEITLSDDAVTIDYTGGDDNIYIPLRPSTAKVNVLTNGAPDLMQELYTGSAKGVKVTITQLSDSTVVWAGWVTPNSYDSDYSGETDKFEVSCDDGLTMLSNLKYRSTSKSVLTVKDIILKILQQCEVYTNLYIHNSFTVDGLTSDCPISDLYLPESLFFDKKDDNTQTDDDVAWSCQEALTEICRWLNMCMVAYGDSVYIIDLDALKAGNTSFSKILVSDGTVTQITLSAACSIEQSTYRGSNNSISMEGVFKKVKVTDSFYTTDNIFPDFYDFAQNITASEDAEVVHRDADNNNYGYITSSRIQNEDRKDGNTNLEVFTSDLSQDGTDYYNVVFIKYFDNPYLKLFKYLWNDAEGKLTDVTDVISSVGLNFTNTKTIHGASIVKYDVEKMDSSDYLFFARPLPLPDDVLRREGITSVSFQNYIAMYNPETHHIENSDVLNYPFLQTKTNALPALVGGPNTYLVIQGSYCYHYLSDYPFPFPEGQVDISEGRYYMAREGQYIGAKLKWGDKYWAGGQWVSNECTFSILYMPDSSSDDDRRADATMFKNLEFVNDVLWSMGIDGKGVAIPMPTNGILLDGIPEFTLFKPFDPEYVNHGKHYLHSCVFLKDFSFKAVVGDPSYSDVNSTDTEYTNNTEENTNAVNDFQDQSFKVCTYDGKSVNYSSVAYKQDGAYHYVDKVTAMGYSERQEEHLVRRIITQYQDPAIRLKLVLEDRYAPYTLFSESITGKTYILDSVTINLSEDTSEVSIREIKSIS